MKARTPKASKSPAEIAKGLRTSLESADLGLKRLLQSVEESGLVEGVRNYRCLQAILIQQRQWVGTHEQRQLLPLFHSIAETSAKLHRTFASYAEITHLLAEIEHIEPTPPDTSSPQNDP